MKGNHLCVRSGVKEALLKFCIFVRSMQQWSQKLSHDDVSDMIWQLRMWAIASVSDHCFALRVDVVQKWY